MDQIVESFRNATNIGDHFSFVVKILKPILGASKLFGIFPYSLKGNTLSFRTTRTTQFFSTLVISFGFLMFWIQFLSIFISIFFKHGLRDNVLQTLWFSSNFVSVSLAIFWRTRQDEFSKFVEKWSTESVGLYLPQKELKRLGRGWFALYSFLCLLQCTSVCLHSYYNPQFSSYFLAHWSHLSAQPLSHGYVVAQTTCMGLWSIYIWVGCGHLEIFSCIMAHSFVYALDKISEEVSEVTQRERVHSADMVAWTNKTGDRDIISPQGISAASSESAIDQPPILKLLKKYQKVATIQNGLNYFFGPAILVDFIQLFFMICTVSYLTIEFSESLDFGAAIIFCIIYFTVMIRLFFVVISLGNVYPAGLAANVSFGNAVSTGYFGRSTNIAIDGHLSASLGSPICFSAWGFFVVTRGTLLTLLSLVVTYLIVLLQT